MQNNNNMNTKVILFLAFVAGIALCTAIPVGSNNNGERSGHYDAQGRYVHDVIPYRHVHDNRELGFYKHIPYPYDGGYGPYNGSNIPYMHVDVPYDHNLYTVSNAEFKVPEIKLEYGFPEYEPQIEITSNTANPVVKSSADSKSQKAEQ